MTDDMTVMQEEELVRRMAVHAPTRDTRTIRKFLRGEITRPLLRDELERAKVAAQAEMVKARK